MDEKGCFVFTGSLVSGLGGSLSLFAWFYVFAFFCFFGNVVCLVVCTRHSLEIKILDFSDRDG